MNGGVRPPCGSGWRPRISATRPSKSSRSRAAVTWMTIHPLSTRRFSRLRSWSICPCDPACHTPSYSIAIFNSGQARSTRATKPFPAYTEYWTSGVHRPRNARRTRSCVSCGEPARASASPTARPNRRHPRSPFRSCAYASSSDRRTSPAPSMRSINTTASATSNHWAKSQQVRTGSVTASSPSIRTSLAAGHSCGSEGPVANRIAELAGRQPRPDPWPRRVQHRTARPQTSPRYSHSSAARTWLPRDSAADEYPRAIGRRRRPEIAGARPCYAGPEV